MSPTIQNSRTEKATVWGEIIIVVSTGSLRTQIEKGHERNF